MALFSSGKFAKAMCDRCGDKIAYKDLREEWTGFKVCIKCLDPKTKLEFPTYFPTDPESLRDPRPDADVESGAGIARTTTSIGGALNGGSLRVDLGKVTVTIT